MNTIKFQHTGTPIKGSKRVQFNMFIRPIKNLKFTENLTTALVPIMWVDEVTKIINT